MLRHCCFLGKFASYIFFRFKPQPYPIQRMTNPLERFHDDVRFHDEWHKMVTGQTYDASYPPFLTLLSETRKAIRLFNNLDPEDTAAMQEALQSILGKAGSDIQINQPFKCDYGCNISIGNGFFANFNLTILDEAPVSIGDNVFIGPNVSIFTACHSVIPEQRRDRSEWAEPVTIGNDAWIGGCAVILPGVTIGDGATIGAGSVVTKNIPPRVVAAGNPCRVIKKV